LFHKKRKFLKGAADLPPLLDYGLTPQRSEKSLAEFARKGEKIEIHFCAGVYRAKIQGAGERTGEKHYYYYK
jgi:hypothetical protein